jgi:quercetin dioxygenase-like cupin family protein
MNDVKAPATDMAVTNPNVRIQDQGGSLMMDLPEIEAIPWWESEDLPGLSTKTLMYNPTNGLSVLLTKVKKGVRLPVHVHHSEVAVFVLQGRFTYYPTGSIGAGGFGYEAYGVVHEPDFPSEEETVFYAVSTNHGLFQFYNEDGSLGKLSHARDRLKDARARYGHAAVAHLNLPDWFWED